jgi:hypothetical protein
LLTVVVQQHAPAVAAPRAPRHVRLAAQVVIRQTPNADSTDRRVAI